MQSINYEPSVYSSESYPDAITDQKLLLELSPVFQRVTATSDAPHSVSVFTDSFSFDASDTRFFVCDGFLCSLCISESHNAFGVIYVIGKAPDGLMGAIRSAARRQAGKNELIVSDKV